MIDDDTRIANLALWREVEKTDPKFTKKIKAGSGLTAICAQWQRRKATELFGPFGQAWNVTNESFEVLQRSEEPRDALLVYHATLSYPNGSFQIHSDIDLWIYSHRWKTYTRVSDPHKKVVTDALTKGLSILGFSADVHMGLHDDNKYICQIHEEFSPAPEPTTKADSQKLADWTMKIDECADTAAVESTMAAIVEAHRERHLTDGQLQELRSIGRIKYRELNPKKGDDHG